MLPVLDSVFFATLPIAPKPTVCIEENSIWLCVRVCLCVIFFLLIWSMKSFTFSICMIFQSCLASLLLLMKPRSFQWHWALLQMGRLGREKNVSYLVNEPTNNSKSKCNCLENVAVSGDTLIPTFKQIGHHLLTQRRIYLFTFSLNTFRIRPK